MPPGLGGEHRLGAEHPAHDVARPAPVGAVGEPQLQRGVADGRLSSSGVPSATLRPRSMTAIRSASWSASSRYCVVSSTVQPSATSSRMVSHIWPRVRGSRPVVGSSRKISGGRVIRLAARSSRRRMPPENCAIGLSAASSRPNCSSSSLGGRRAPARRQALQAAEQPQVLASRSGSRRPRRTARSRRPAGAPRAGRGRRRRRRSRRGPPSIGSSVASIFSIVVLPAPFGPSTPKISPWRTSRSTPSTARRSPKALHEAGCVDGRGRIRLVGVGHADTVGGGGITVPTRRFRVWQAYGRPREGGAPCPTRSRVPRSCISRHSAVPSRGPVRRAAPPSWRTTACSRRAAGGTCASARAACARSARAGAALRLLHADRGS